MAAELTQFLSAVTGRWFIYMSGAPSVPLAIAAVFVQNTAARIGLAITAALCLLLAAFFVWREEHRKVVALEQRLAPKFALRFDPTVPSCRAPTVFSDSAGTKRVNGLVFRIMVENVGEETVYGCEARLVEVHHIQKPNELAPMRLFWVGDTASVDLIRNAPAFINLINVLETGEKHVPSAQGWSLAHFSMFDEPGDYLFRLVVSGKNTLSQPYAVRLTLTGNWQTARMEPV